MTKTDLIFQAFSTRFVDFAVQFCFRCKFSFHEKRRSSQAWQWRDFFSTNHNSLLRIANNDIASFCRDKRLRQMAFFVFPKVGKGGANASCRVMLKYFEINKSFMCNNLFCYYIKQIDSMLPCVCSVIDHRRR